MGSNLALDSRIAVAAGLGLLGLSAAVSAAVGLPLFGDGSLYFLEMVLEREPLVPNQRFGALIPQLPLVLATAMTDRVTVLRHVFCFAYGLLPLLSALACWLIVRHREPELMVFPALFLATNQINFSAVSELLLCLYLGWPFLLYARLRPSGTKLRMLGLALAPLLFFLHPLASARRARGLLSISRQRGSSGTAVRYPTAGPGDGGAPAAVTEHRFPDGCPRELRHLVRR